MTTSSRPAEEGVPDGPARLRSGLPELICAFSLSLDAAEGREPGHAIRVAHVTKLLATALDLDRDQRWAALSAGLLHDVGAPAAAALLTGVPGADEEALFRSAPTAHPAVTDWPASQRERVVEALRLHVSAGASFLNQPWIPAASFEAVRSHHENWDGSGYPDQLAGAAIPPLARILRAADLFEAVVAGEANPLHARARARAVVQQWSGREIAPSVAEALEAVIADDRFWLGFYDEALGEVLVGEAAGEGVPPSTKLLWAFSEAVAAMVDAKSGHQPGRAAGVMRLARDLGEAIHLPPMRLELLALAAYWLDVGALGIPKRILMKPDLLSLEEMQRMRLHPAFSQEILGRIPILAEAAPWVGAHHERPDGRGYPDLLQAPEIPTEAGILSLADAYVSMTSARPYRDALSPRDALKVITAGAGTQWDPFLVRIFADTVASAEATAAS